MTRKASPKHTLPLAPPGGMRDLLYPEAAERRMLLASILRVFAQHGYDLVTTPPFELASVIERGLAAVDRRDLLRFVEPDTGEVALLRPDITPQIARVIATRLADRPAPYRLAYDGTVIRRRRGRARRQKQIAQAGIECVGIADTSGDAEVISLAVLGCHASGLHQFHLELGHVAIGIEALAEVPAQARGAAKEALAHKDGALLEALLVRAGATRTSRKRLLDLVGFDGDLSVLRRARRTFTSKTAKRALAQLMEVAEGVGIRFPGVTPSVDLSNVRGASYYTGTHFTLFANGPGEPIGTGGRYDNLLAQFDCPLPATGFAFDIENLEEALRAAGTRSRTMPARIVAAGAPPKAAADVLARLRAANMQVVPLSNLSASESLAFAKSWHYDAVATFDKRGLRVTPVHERRTARVFEYDSLNLAASVSAFARNE